MPSKSKILILLLIIAAALKTNAQTGYVTNMGYDDYYFKSQANIGKGTIGTTHPSAYLELGLPTNSKRAFLLPRGNKDSVQSPTYGLLFYNVQDSSVYWYNGLQWKIFSPGAVSNNYLTGASYNSDIFTLSRSGMSDVTVTLPFSAKLNVADSANKWVNNLYRRNDSVFFKVGSLEVFAFTLTYTWPGISTDYIKGDGSIGDFVTDLFTNGDTRYSLIGHTHLASDVTDLTPVVRNMFDGDSNINVNHTTGKITFTGIVGGSADGNNYVNTGSFSNNTLTLGRLGLSPLTISWDSSKYHSKLFYDGIYQPVGSYALNSDLALKVNITDTANKWVSNFYKRGDSVFFKKGSTEYFAFIDSVGTGGGSGNPNSNIGSGYRLAIPYTNNIKTLFSGYGVVMDSTSNTNGITFKIDSSQFKMFSYLEKVQDTIARFHWTDGTYNDVAFSLAVNNRGEITTAAGWFGWTINNGAVTNAKVATGIDAVKIADGSVSNAEYQYSDGLSGNIQSQLNNKLDSVKLSNDSLYDYHNGTRTFRGKATGGTGGSGGLVAGMYKWLKFTIDSTNAPTAGKDSIDLSSIVPTGMHLQYDREYAHEHDSVSYWWNATTRVLKVSPAWFGGEHNELVFTPDSLWTALSLPAPVGYDADAQAYFDATTISNTTTKDAINAFVVGLKTDGLWTKYDFIHILSNGSEASTKYNLKDPQDLDASYRLTFVNSATFASTGVTTNGTNQYINTHYLMISAAHASMNNLHVGVYNRTTAGVAGFTYGTSDGTSLIYGLCRSTDDKSYFRSPNTSENNYADATTGKGFYLQTNRVSPAPVVQLYKDGVQKFIGAYSFANPSLPATYPLLFNAYNSTGTINQFRAGELAFICAGSGFTDTEIANFNSRVQTLATALGW